MSKLQASRPPPYARLEQRRNKYKSDIAAFAICLVWLKLMSSGAAGAVTQDCREILGASTLEPSTPYTTEFDGVSLWNITRVEDFFEGFNVSLEAEFKINPRKCVYDTQKNISADRPTPAALAIQAMSSGDCISVGVSYWIKKPSNQSLGINLTVNGVPFKQEMTTCDEMQSLVHGQVETHSGEQFVVSCTAHQFLLI
jgi:hypothetical protein